MGITGELVRNVFSKSRSVQRHHQDSHAHHQARKSYSATWEKKRWSNSVRSYLCGDEYSSVLAAEDSASVRSSTVAEVDVASFRTDRATSYVSTSRADDSVASACGEVGVDTASEATVDQPLNVCTKDDDDDDESQKQKHNSTYKLFQQEDAAAVIQSAFRNFLARRGRDRGASKMEDDDNGDKNNEVMASSPSRDSIGTSIEVQTGNSSISDIFSIKDESFDLRRSKMRHARARAQVLKLQEEWDCSTVSSVISKMRIQNKLEAATRRERALAYAFSQQLRICSKKKHSTGAKGDGTNTGWSWLERWMAARQQEITLMDDNTSQKAVVKKRIMFDAAGMVEEESCGSNEVPNSLVHELNIPASVPRNVPRPPPAKTRINNNKMARNLSSPNSASAHLSPKESKDTKKVCHVEDEKEKRKRPKQQQPGSHKRDIKHKDGTAQISLLEQETHQQ